MGEKFETQFEKIVGGTEKEKAQVREKLQARLEDAEDIPRGYAEILKTKKDVELIRRTENDAYDMIRAYGGSPKPMPLEKVHIVPRKKVFEESGGKFGGGWHGPIWQYIVAEKGRSEIQLIQTLAHEIFHKGAYKSAQIYENRRLENFFRKKKGMDLKRSGIEIIKRDFARAPGEQETYFKKIEEAIVAIMTDRFLYEKLSRRPEYTRAFADMNKIKSWLEQMPVMFPERHEANKNILAELPYLHAVEGADRLIKVLESTKNNEYRFGYLHGFLQDAEERGLLIASDRMSEQKEFMRLLDDLVGRGVYATKTEAFDAFARANFSGNLLPLGKRIDGVLGRGEFKKIAEKFKEEPRRKSTLSKIAGLFKR